MYYYKARIYSPTLGRFLQTDPIGYEDQVNLYAYVGNDPVNTADPSGQKRYKFELNIGGSLGLGLRMDVSVEIDTETAEVGGSVTARGQYGIDGDVRAGVEISPSVEKGNFADVLVDSSAEAGVSGELGDRDIGVSGEIRSTGTRRGTDQRGFQRVEGGVTGSVDATVANQRTDGTTRIGIGGEAGATVGVNVTGSANINVRSVAEKLKNFGRKD